MLFHKTPLSGAFLIELEKKGDERGFFARLYCSEEFKKRGLDDSFVQTNNSFSMHKGTLRGIHYQIAPKSESKLVRCIRGSFYDVIVDLRPDSPSYGKHFGIELTAENRHMLYVPKGFGHAFLTLEECTEALYMVSEFYSPQHERGIRWNDPAFNIKWPFTPCVISDKDQNHPLYQG